MINQHDEAVKPIYHFAPYLKVENKTFLRRLGLKRKKKLFVTTQIGFSLTFRIRYGFNPKFYFSFSFTGIFAAVTTFVNSVLYNGLVSFYYELQPTVISVLLPLS